MSGTVRVTTGHVTLGVRARAEAAPVLSSSFVPSSHRAQAVTKAERGGLGGREEEGGGEVLWLGRRNKTRNYSHDPRRVNQARWTRARGVSKVERRKCSSTAFVAARVRPLWLSVSSFVHFPFLLNLAEGRALRSLHANHTAPVESLTLTARRTGSPGSACIQLPAPIETGLGRVLAVVQSEGRDLVETLLLVSWRVITEGTAMRLSEHAVRACRRTCNSEQVGTAREAMSDRWNRGVTFGVRAGVAAVDATFPVKVALVSPVKQPDGYGRKPLPTLGVIVYNLRLKRCVTQRYYFAG